MRMALVLLVAALVVLACVASSVQVSKAQGQYANGLLPAVPVPADNPQTDCKIRLGAQLYFEKRLSSDGTISCASCHRPDKAWADIGPVSEGVSHQKGGRNSPSIIDSAYVVPQFWDGRALHLEKQAVGPVQNPIEMDLTVAELEFRLNHIPGYVAQFQEVFGSRPSIDLMAKAIASFERTVVTGDSPYDEYIQGDRSAMSEAAMRGMHLFSGKGHCNVCHSGPAFSDSRFHNLGVGYANGKFKDVGRFNVTKDPKDMGAFLTQRLRNVALTPPYLHDGSEQTIEGVIDLYNRGGIPNPKLDPTMVPLNLTEREKSDLVEFMKALTGPYPIMEAPPLPNPELTAQKLAEMMKGVAK
ncbi:MAG TPA: cytochrome c peroxidase [Armatimonadota bacterium]|nr:cytochrome c peroxidase [Armatimonadota bacterium]